MPLSLSSPEHNGFDRQYLKDIVQFLERDYLDTGKLSGFSYLIARNNNIVALECRGRSTMGSEKHIGFPLTLDSIFRIYSMTKPITSVALMMLVEDGHIRLDHLVKDFIPSFSNMDVWIEGTLQSYTTRKPDREITIHDLLTHQSGLTYDFIPYHPVDAIYRNKQLNTYTARMRGKTLEAFIQELSEIPLIFSPGTRWNYSLGVDIIGRIIEIISGQTLETFFKTNIFIPLSMSDTGFNISAEQAKRLTHCYKHNPSTKNIQVMTNDNEILSTPTQFFSGGGGLMSTLSDYYKFCRMLHNNGIWDGTRILKEDTLKLMRCNHLTRGGDLTEYGDTPFSESSDAGNGFGIGWSVMVHSERSLLPNSKGTYSWGGIANTYFWIDPLEDMIVIFMTQLIPVHCYMIRNELQTYVYRSLVNRNTFQNT